MKLIIQIPCFDEADHLPQTLADLPCAVEGFDAVEFLVIDDGSSDGTANVAFAHGAHHVVRHVHNCGLAASFMTGIAASLARGADVIVNTDGDNQYCGADIPSVVAPVREGRADFSMGVRPLHDGRSFALWKSALTRMGTTLARLLSGLPVQDAPSGLRAYSAASARELRVSGRFSYTMETLVLAGSRGWRMAQVPVRVNPVARRSRLMSSVPQYIRKSVLALLCAVAAYRPRLMTGMIAAAAISLAMIVAFILRYAGFAPMPASALCALAVGAIGGVWAWRVRSDARERDECASPETLSVDAVVGADPPRGDDFARVLGDQEKPLADVDPVAGVGVSLAAAAGERRADG
jgi:hypothetical protein